MRRVGSLDMVIFTELVLVGFVGRVFITNRDPIIQTVQFKSHYSPSVIRPFKAGSGPLGR